MKKFCALFSAAFLAFALNVSGQTCDDLKGLIDKSYGFKPSKLTAEQIDAKSAELDKVWNMVETNTEVLLPCLISEISRRKDDSFFRFNASNLLYKHDQSVATKKLMIETYSGADLADINLRYWLPYMAKFGEEGLDVTKAGQTWLRFPKPVYYLPQHGPRPIDKGVGALAIFGSMDESIATPVLAQLASEKDTDFRSIAIWLLVKQATSDSDKAVTELATKVPSPLSDRLIQDVSKPKLVAPREGTPKTSRETFVKAMNELLEGRPDSWIELTVEVKDGERVMVAVLSEADLPLIRKFRRKYAANATPHSPDWYETFTQIINTLRSKKKGK